MNLKNNIKYIILWLFILLPFNMTNAAHIENNNSLNFSLSVANLKTHFNFSANNYETKTDLLGINWYETFSPYFNAGFEVGYLNMSQRKNILPSAQFTTGQYAGLLLQLVPLNRPLFSLTLNLNYRYNRTEGSSTNQATQFAWNETLLFTDFHFYPVDRIFLTLAAEQLVFNGEQKDSGTITKITPFKESQRHGYRIGLNFIDNRSGTVGIEWMTGFRTGSRLYFSRKF